MIEEIAGSDDDIKTSRRCRQVPDAQRRGAAETVALPPGFRD